MKACDLCGKSEGELRRDLRGLYHFTTDINGDLIACAHCFVEHYLIDGDTIAEFHLVRTNSALECAYCKEEDDE